METDFSSLATIFDGWDGYQTSLMDAIEPLTAEQLAWRPRRRLRSVGEVAAHLATGRVYWLARLQAPGSAALERKAAETKPDAIAASRAQILWWLEASWKMVANTMHQFTVSDLLRTYRHEYQGQVYQVSYQWTIWRVMTHDIHHGGELALMLGMQGIAVPELGDLFGHLTMPPKATD